MQFHFFADLQVIHALNHLCNFKLRITLPSKLNVMFNKHATLSLCDN